MMNSNQVLTWFMKQKNEDTMENINREMLFKLIEDQEFLAVFFCKFIIINFFIVILQDFFHSMQYKYCFEIKIVCLLICLLILRPFLYL